MTGLKNYLLEEWVNLDQNEINDLIQSARERFKFCLEGKGKFIGHLLNRTSTESKMSEDSISKKLIFGKLIPENLNLLYLSKIVKLCENSVKAIPSQNDIFVWINFQDPRAFISKDSLPRSILVKFENHFSIAFIFGKTMADEARISIGQSERYFY
jgi:hypothetical protein